MPQPLLTPIHWDIQSTVVAGVRILLARLRVDILLPGALANEPTFGERCWFDSGAPVSIVPHAIQRLGLNWQPLPRAKTTWLGQPAVVGYFDLWFPSPAGRPPAGPFRTLAKFAQADLPGPAVPVLLELEFLLAHQAAAALLTPPQPSSLTLP